MTDEVSKNILTVYAYGVVPLYRGPLGRHYEHLEGGIKLWEPYAFCHYWIDSSLQYHEETKSTGAIPALHFITGSRTQVELAGRGEYKIRMT